MTKAQLERMGAALDAGPVYMARMVKDPDYVGSRTVLDRVPWEQVLTRCMSLGFTPCEHVEESDEAVIPIVLRLEPPLRTGGK